MLYFTADQHFGHKNIIEFQNRPFKSVKDMDEALIYHWNTAVGEEDTVFHLGDFTFHDEEVAKLYIKRLNGTIYFLSNPWHHDKRWLPKDFGLTRFKTKTQGKVYTLPPIHVINLKDPRYLVNGFPRALVLSHYPQEDWERKHWESIHLHGHSHGAALPMKRRMDVGVDAYGMVPVSLSEVMELIND